MECYLSYTSIIRNSHKLATFFAQKKQPPEGGSSKMEFIWCWGHLYNRRFARFGKCKASKTTLRSGIGLLPL